MLTRIRKTARMSERANERETEKKLRWTKFHGKFASDFFSYLKCNNNNNHHHVICKSISVFSMGKIMCYKYEFSVRCFFFTWRFALRLALQKWWHTLCKVSFKNHTTSNPSWMSGQHNVHRSQFLSFFRSLWQMYVKLTIALLNLSRHHQPLVVIRLK